MEKIIADLTALDQIAQKIALQVRPGIAYLLVGELGAGKTTFTKLLFAHLGIKTPVTSPTFVLMKKYQGLIKLYHIDGYRLESKEDLGFSELLEDGAVFVEWPDKLLPFWNQFQVIRFTFLDNERRIVEIFAPGEKYV